MSFAGLPPSCQHLPDPVAVRLTSRWLSVEDVAREMGWSTTDFIRGTWDRMVAETWARGGTDLGGTPLRMALCSKGFVDSWRMDARDMPAFMKGHADMLRAREAAFLANRPAGPTGPRTTDWLTFRQVAKGIGLSESDPSLAAFWVSVTHPENIDRRREPYMRGVRTGLRDDPRTDKSSWCLYAPDLDRFGRAYGMALRRPAPKVPAPEGSVTCEEGWALFGKGLSWDTYHLAWNYRTGMSPGTAENLPKTLAGAYAVAGNVKDRHSRYGDRHTPISVLMNRVEPDLRPTVRRMLGKMVEEGTVGTIGPLKAERQVVCMTYVDGVPLPSVTNEFLDRFMAEARMVHRPAREAGPDTPAPRM